MVTTTGIGIYQIISLLLALAGFGVSANPKPPTANAVLNYAPADSDVYMFADLVSVVPGNYQAFEKLADAPELKNSPAVHDGFSKAVAKMESMRGLVKSAVGIDLATDMNDIALFVHFSANPAGERTDSVMMVVHGHFPTDIVDRVSKMTHMPTETLNGVAALTFDRYAAALTKDGTMLFGSKDWVGPRLASSWSALPRGATSSAARFAKIIDGKPALALGVNISDTLMARLPSNDHSIRKLMRGYQVAFMQNYDFIGGSINSTGVSWEHYCKTVQAFDNTITLFDGYVDLMRAFQLAPRGFLRLGMSMIDSLATVYPVAKELADHKKELTTLFNRYPSDGNFKVAFDKNAKTLHVGLRATGSKLSDVLPVSFILPFVVAGGYAALAPHASSGSDDDDVEVMPAPPAAQHNNALPHGGPKH